MTAHPILGLVERIQADAAAIALDLADLVVLATDRPRGDDDKVHFTKMAYYNDSGSHDAKNALRRAEKDLLRQFHAMQAIRANLQSLFEGESADDTIRGSHIHPEELAALIARRDLRWNTQQAGAGSELEGALIEYEPHRIEEQPAHPAEKKSR